MFHRVLTILGQTHGEVEERITYHTPAHTQAPPYLIVADEKAMRVTLRPKRTGDVALMICWITMRKTEVVDKAKYLL